MNNSLSDALDQLPPFSDVQATQAALTQQTGDAVEQVRKVLEKVSPYIIYIYECGQIKDLIRPGLSPSGSVIFARLQESNGAWCFFLATGGESYDFASFLPKNSVLSFGQYEKQTCESYLQEILTLLVPFIEHIAFQVKEALEKSRAKTVDISVSVTATNQALADLPTI